MHEISATWQVPTVAAGPREANASTWVGADDPLGNFVQIGTDEGEGLLNTNKGFYRAFWSSSAVHFRPRDLGVVQAGDTVTAEMIQQADGWVLTLADATHPTTFREATHFDGNQSYSYLRAEWFQEDPEPDDSHPLEQGVYPTMSTVRFSHLRVNGHPPVVAYSNAHVLVAPIQGVVLVPTPVTDAGFAVQPANDVQAAYALAIAPVLADEIDLRAEVNNGFQDGAGMAATALETDLESASGMLRARTWPPGVTAPIATVIKQLDRTSLKFADMPLPLKPDAVAVAITDQALFDADVRIRHALELPAPS